jgi:hypothetical protein
MLFQVMFEPCCKRTAVHELRNLLGSGLQLHVATFLSVYSCLAKGYSSYVWQVSGARCLTATPALLQGDDGTGSGLIGWQGNRTQGAVTATMQATYL